VVTAIEAWNLEGEGDAAILRLGVAAALRKTLGRVQSYTIQSGTDGSVLRLAFGFAVWLGAHEFVMPWIGLTPPVWSLPADEQLAECFGHMFWGLAIGVFYEYFRRRWATDEVLHPATQVRLELFGARNVNHVGISAQRR